MLVQGRHTYCTAVVIPTLFQWFIVEVHGGAQAPCLLLRLEHRVKQFPLQIVRRCTKPGEEMLLDCVKLIQSTSGSVGAVRTARFEGVSSPQPLFTNPV